VNVACIKILPLPMQIIIHINLFLKFIEINLDGFPAMNQKIRKYIYGLKALTYNFLRYSGRSVTLSSMTSGFFVPHDSSFLGPVLTPIKIAQAFSAQV